LPECPREVVSRTLSTRERADPGVAADPAAAATGSGRGSDAVPPFLLLLYSAVRRGGVPEWLKGADCKSVGLRLRWFESSLLHQNASCSSCWESMGPCGCSSMVEQKPSKLTTRVRFPSPAPAIAPAELWLASHPGTHTREGALTRQTGAATWRACLTSWRGGRVVKGSRL